MNMKRRQSMKTRNLRKNMKKVRIVAKKNAKAKKITKNVSAAKTKKSVNVDMMNTKNLNVVKRKKNVILKHYWKTSSVTKKNLIVRLY